MNEYIFKIITTTDFSVIDTMSIEATDKMIAEMYVNAIIPMFDKNGNLIYSQYVGIKPF